MRPIGGNKVDHRHRVFDRQPEVFPACIGLQIDNAEVVVKLRTGFIQRGNPGFTPPRHVQRGQIKRQAQQVALQRGHDELVDFIANVPRQAADDIGVGFRQRGPAGHIHLRVQESGNQRCLGCFAVHKFKIIGQTVNRIGQHRMAKAVNGMGEFSHD